MRAHLCSTELSSSIESASGALAQESRRLQSKFFHGRCLFYKYCIHLERRAAANKNERLLALVTLVNDSGLRRPPLRAGQFKKKRGPSFPPNAPFFLAPLPASSALCAATVPDSILWTSLNQPGSTTQDWAC